MQGSIGTRQQSGKTLLALDERPRHPVFGVEIEQIEQKENEGRGVAACPKRAAGY
jgi:hypothetical protein